MTRTLLSLLVIQAAIAIYGCLFLSVPGPDLPFLGFYYPWMWTAVSLILFAALAIEAIFKRWG